MKKNNQPVFSAFAVSLTGNRGAVSMLESAIDYLTSEEHPGFVNVFTVYPKLDRTISLPPQISVHNGTPVNLVFKLIPLCLLFRFLALVKVNISPTFYGRDMQALLETDVCLMIGGTTFSDAQLIKVFYNVICLLPAIILGKKSMMYSQTMGPFKSKINRLLARWSLSKMDFIVPRGQSSFENVVNINLKTPVQFFADSAFTLHIPLEIERDIHNKYDGLFSGKKVVGISVNSIVQEKCEALGIDHDGAWVKVIQYLIARDFFVVMIPHSLRQRSKDRHNNDLLAVEAIQKRIDQKENLMVINEPYSSKELRVVVGLMDYYIASRFHSMISCLCTGVPVLVFGWGFQKYKEVMQDFDLEKYCHDAAEISPAAIITGFEEIEKDAQIIKDKCKLYLPRVRNSSEKNHETAWNLAIK